MILGRPHVAGTALADGVLELLVERVAKGLHIEVVVGVVDEESSLFAAVRALEVLPYRADVLQVRGRGLEQVGGFKAGRRQRSAHSGDLQRGQPVREPLRLRQAHSETGGRDHRMTAGRHRGQTVRDGLPVLLLAALVGQEQLHTGDPSGQARRLAALQARAAVRAALGGVGAVEALPDGLPRHGAAVVRGVRHHECDLDERFALVPGGLLGHAPVLLSDLPHDPAQFGAERAGGDDRIGDADTLGAGTGQSAGARGYAFPFVVVRWA